jgi:hypothetical protein
MWSMDRCRICGLAHSKNIDRDALDEARAPNVGGEAGTTSVDLRSRLELYRVAFRSTMVSQVEASAVQISQAQN